MEKEVPVKEKRTRKARTLLNDLYDINQIFKKYPYTYNSELNKFSSVIDNTVLMNYYDSSFSFNESFKISDGISLYKTLSTTSKYGGIVNENNKLYILNDMHCRFDLEDYSHISTISSDKSGMILLDDTNSVVLSGIKKYDNIYDLFKEIYSNRTALENVAVYLNISIDDEGNFIIESKDSRTDLDMSSPFIILDVSKFYYPKVSTKGRLVCETYISNNTFIIEIKVIEKNVETIKLEYIMKGYFIEQ